MYYGVGMKSALITGCTGQDGSYLAEHLLGKGYRVHGIIRRSSSFNTGRIDHIFDRLCLHHGDVTDAPFVERIIRESQPSEIYNLAGQSHVAVSFEMPSYTVQVDAVGLLNILEAVRSICVSTGPRKPIRIYHASTSELYGDQCPEGGADESTPFKPRSPYGCAKLCAHSLAVNYREAYNLHVSCGILFNHESERRGETFVTRKIARAAARIKAGLQDCLVLGNLDARRDWGYAPDYVDAMWRMLQQDAASDYVIATGEPHSVREFLDAAFGRVGLKWQDYVEVGAQYLRPSEVPYLRGNAAKARNVLGWRPSTGFGELVARMVDYEVARVAISNRQPVSPGPPQ